MPQEGFRSAALSPSRFDTTGEMQGKLVFFKPGLDAAHEEAGLPLHGTTRTPAAC